jgi:hypothetical protein
MSFWSNEVILKPFHLTSPRDLDLAHGFKSELFIILVLDRKPFFNEVILMPQHQYVRGLLDSKFLDDKPVFHLKILQNIILKVFPYLDDGPVSDLLRSCLRVLVI